MNKEIRNLIKHKLHDDYMLVEFELMDRNEFEIRKGLLKELMLEIEVEEGYEKS